jgi:class 3 adenylate cyclase
MNAEMPDPTTPSAPETRKTVTILFIDAVSSTALGEEMDPESLRVVMTRYFEVMEEAIESHGGAVEKFIGDAVMAVFGVPVVHEDDALRACRAAVDIRRRLTEIEPEMRAERGVAIEWRMGINTGPVVAGDMAFGQRIVTGDAVNVASRLEAAAAAGEILIGGETHSLVRYATSAEPVAPLSLKGKSRPVAAWRLLGVKEVPRPRSRPQDAPLVGREGPMQLLQGAFRQVVEGRVCISSRCSAPPASASRAWSTNSSPGLAIRRRLPPAVASPTAAASPTGRWQRRSGAVSRTLGWWIRTSPRQA